MAQENLRRFRIVRDSDVVGFLDLAGLERGRREHAVLQDGERLVARYETANGPIDFVLSGPSDASFALDAGERVLLADFCARRAGEFLRQGRNGGAIGWLTQAVEELDFVIDAIPGDQERVPEGAFENPRGKQAWAHEKGRFSRDRLVAYRDSLRAQREELQAQPLKESAFINAQVIVEEVRPLLAALSRDRAGEVGKTLRPRAADYPQVFQPAAVEPARAHFDGLWDQGINFDFPSTTQSEILIAVAPAGMFASENELSRNFPGGYRTIAKHLQPHRVWIGWKYAKPGESSGLAYDGLVWIEDHWSWFPKPYRVNW